MIIVAAPRLRAALQCQDSANPCEQSSSAPLCESEHAEGMSVFEYGLESPQVWSDVSDYAEAQIEESNRVKNLAGRGSSGRARAERQRYLWRSRRPVPGISFRCLSLFDAGLPPGFGP